MTTLLFLLMSHWSPNLLVGPDAFLVLKTGRVVPVAGEFNVSGQWVRFRTRENGDLMSLPLAEVDLEASWQRTDDWRRRNRIKQQYKPKTQQALLPLERPPDRERVNRLDADKVPPPKLYRHPLLLPTFETAYGSLYAGSAFLLRLEKGGPVLMVTAHGLLGKAAGLTRDLTWWELPRSLQSVSAWSVRDGKTWRSEKVLSIDDARAAQTDDASHDLAAFLMNSPKAVTFQLSPAPPQVGERVWLYSDPARDKVLAGEILHEARISDVNDEMIEYRFLNPKTKLEGARGAAVVNASGQVVAMHVAGGFLEGRQTGWGNPAAAMRARLTRALSPNP